MARAMCMAVTFMLATAVAQASQCASGGDCPTDREPQTLVSLLQTKLRMNVLEDGPSLMKNPSAMLAEFEGMVRSGETPAFDLVTTIKNLIEDDIMPGLQTTRDAAADATSEALREIQSCNNKSKTEEARIAAINEMSVNNARSLHAACREAQMILHDHNLTDPDAYCVKLGEFLHGATPLEIKEGATRDESVRYVQEASLQNMCDSTKVCELDDGCTAAEAELADKEAECIANQRSFESQFCTWKVELETNCRTLDTCHSQAVTDYESHVSKTKDLVDKWDVETAALHKILCYCNVWLAEMDDCDNRSKHNATQFDVCRDQTYSRILVNYGTPAAKVACPLTSVAIHPGTSGFVTQEYDRFTPGFIDAVVPCPGATTEAPTTEAPTTAGAPCERVNTSSDCFESTENFYLLGGQFYRADVNINPSDQCCWGVSYRGNPAVDDEVCKYDAEDGLHVYRGDCMAPTTVTEVSTKCGWNHWELGEHDQSCTDACADRGLTCSLPPAASRNEACVSALASAFGVSCSGGAFYPGNWTPAPWVITSESRCTVETSTTDTATFCSHAEETADMRRFCPCQ